MDLFSAFITGLTTGGLSCLAVQGGLLTSILVGPKKLVQNKDAVSNGKYSYFLPVGVFLLAKLIIHALFGFLLGFLGSALIISLSTKILFQLLAAFFMVATAMNLLEVHPLFRYVTIQPPRSVGRFINRSARSESIFAPAILGLLTILIPCGVTQAMEVTALSSGSPTWSALLIASFIIGTMPVFAVLGVTAMKLSTQWSKVFSKVTALILIIMALFSINGVLSVADSPLTFQKIVANLSAKKEASIATNKADENNGIQMVTITVTNSGYNPNHLTVKAGIPVELTLKSNGVYSCSLDFIMRQFGIHESLRPTDEKVVRFTPTQKGQFTYSCSMGYV